MQFIKWIPRNRVTFNDFVWPEVGSYAEDPNFQSNKACGNGLHAWHPGHHFFSNAPSYLFNDGVWLILDEVEDFVDLSKPEIIHENGVKQVVNAGKVKFRKCKVVAQYELEGLPPEWMCLVQVNTIIAMHPNCSKDRLREYSVSPYTDLREMSRQGVREKAWLSRSK